MKGAKQDHALTVTSQLLRHAELAGRSNDPKTKQLIRLAAISGNRRLAQKLVRDCQRDAARRLVEGWQFRTPTREELCTGLDPSRCIILGYVKDG